MKIRKNSFGNLTVCEYSRPTEIGQHNNGNSTWNDYRVAGEVLAFRTEQIERIPLERIQKRHDQAKDTYYEKKENLEKFATTQGIILVVEK